MKNISKDEISEGLKKAEDKIKDCVEKIRKISTQKESLKQLESDLLILQLKAEGEKKAYSELLKLFDTDVQEEKV